MEENRVDIPLQIHFTQAAREQVAAMQYNGRSGLKLRIAPKAYN